MRALLTVWKTVVVGWIALAVFASGVPGIVLCFGEDGHVALELAHQGHCQNSEHASGHSWDAVVKLSASDRTDCCGDCVDVSLSADIMSHLVSDVRLTISSTRSLTVFLAAVSMPGEFAGSVALPARHVMRRTPPRASSHLLAQRTVILRI